MFVLQFWSKHDIYTVKTYRRNTGMTFFLPTRSYKQSTNKISEEPLGFEPFKFFHTHVNWLVTRANSSLEVSLLLLLVLSPCGSPVAWQCIRKRRHHHCVAIGLALRRGEQFLGRSLLLGAAWADGRCLLMFGTAWSRVGPFGAFRTDRRCLLVVGTCWGC